MKRKGLCILIIIMIVTSALAVSSCSSADKKTSLRVIVNMDVFLNDETPESTWGEYDNYNNKVTEENPETLDIFEPAMHNLFDTGSIVIDSILDGTIGE